MFRLILIFVIALLASPTFAAGPPKTEEQKTLYAIGLLVSRSIAVFNLSPEELEFVKQGLTDAATGKKPDVDLSSYNDKVQELARARRTAQGEKLAAMNKEFIAKAVAEKGAVKTDSGLIYLSLREGTGTSPTVTDTVKVNYRGTLPDGKEFDSSYKRGTPTEFRLDGVIKCWTDGLQKMKSGGKAKLVCPPNTAYGDAGAGDLILPDATLVFDVELLEVKK
ncbi:FKBP-type peptidyl-prolyl cis-trans isomerase [Geobacter argillaceus]|uniref:Peptidyl-prolyl cis-trans isomerase n=1 Tax=Geobacter argillaceus TaxID=345631 RepID=A0A562WSK7_9BACT|nr:FKBP-type peptidyl-prolyl cis-trans isomerase [Geobacter argillaceus]TWJ33598.1 FKBP-type peptidyl-prolyl cis-trans isomerase FkpA [Geobacter argillaceus]